MFNSEVPRKIRLSGVTFNRDKDNTQHNIDVVTRYGKAPLSVVREPDNQYDPNAIRVAAWDQFHLGYIPKEYSASLASLMDEGKQFTVINYQRIENPYHKIIGISIEIEETEQ